MLKKNDGRFKLNKKGRQWERCMKRKTSWFFRFSRSTFMVAVNFYGAKMIAKKLYGV